jgi:hypothetical protein
MSNRRKHPAVDLGTLQPLCMARLILVLGCIGPGTGSAQHQPVAAAPQDPPIVALPIRDSDLRGIDDALTPGSRASWRTGWQRAADLGSVAVPALWARFQAAESDYRRRLLYLAATGAAGGASARRHVMSVLARPAGGREDHREQFVALELLAMCGASTGAAAPLVELLGRSNPEPQLVVAGCLALRRYPDAVVRPAARWYRSDDPGIAAAVRFARPLTDDRGVEGWFRRTDDEALLVQRGSLLGAEAGRFDGRAAARLRAVLGRRDTAASEVRAAAALHVATAVDLSEWLERGGLPVDPEVVPFLVTTAESRAVLRDRGLLTPPPDRLEPTLRLRTILACVVTGDLDDVAAAGAATRDEREGEIVCLGVAWRFFADPTSADVAWLSKLPASPAREWVRLACGQDSGEQRGSANGDELFEAAFRAARDRRLGGAAAADAIERELWRRGAHPGRSRLDAEFALVRDLLVAGSTYGASVLGRPDDVYLPKGLSRGDTAYEVAYELWRFLSESVRTPPEGARLR